MWLEAVFGYLHARKEVANCRLRFSGFKKRNTLRWLILKVKKKKKKLQRRYLEVNKQDAKYE